MYRCSVELSVQYDGQSQSESEHASLIDEHDSFNSVAKQIRFSFLTSLLLIISFYLGVLRDGNPDAGL